MKYIREKIALGIFILSVIALVILMPFAFFQTRTTGKVIETVEKGIEKTVGEITCADSDGGKNYDIKGVVDYCDSNGCSTNEDSCYGKKLTEWFCENNERHYKEYECDYECDKGVCVTLATKYKYTGGSGGAGGGISGGAGAGGGTVEPSQTYDLGELTSEHHLELIKNDNIRFTILGSEYILTLTDNTPTEVTINTNSGQTHNIMVGSEKNMDLNNNGGPETYIKIKSINIITGKIALIFRAA